MPRQLLKYFLVIEGRWLNVLYTLISTARLARHQKLFWMSFIFLCRTSRAILVVASRKQITKKSLRVPK